MKNCEVYCYTDENYVREYELVFGMSDKNGSNYRLLCSIGKISRNELENMVNFLKEYVEKTNGS